MWKCHRLIVDLGLQMPNRIGRPKLRPAQTFKQYCERCRGARSSIIYPCPQCNGVGIIYDPNDPPDPYEGNKLRRRISCLSCKGTGETTRVVLHEAWKKDREKHKEQRRAYQEMCNMLSSIEKKLTKKQVDFLKQQCGRRISETQF